MPSRHTLNPAVRMQFLAMLNRFEESRHACIERMLHGADQKIAGRCVILITGELPAR